MKFLNLLLPPILGVLLRKVIKKKPLAPPPITEGLEIMPDHATAVRCSRGYEDALILEKCLQSALLVKAGKACFERDSIAFYEPAWTLTVLACLEHIHSFYQKPLHVLDFGGSLGSFFLQHRAYFAQKAWTLNWTVVEQAHFVQAGQQYFSDVRGLNFAKDLPTAFNVLEGTVPNVLFLSGVLPYLPEPLVWLKDTLNAYQFPFVIMDRTLFASDGKAYYSVQHVPSHIYQGSYPCTILAESDFHAILSNYECLTCFKSLVDDHEHLNNGVRVNYQGGFWVKKNRR